MHHDSFLELLMTLHPSPTNPTKDILRKDDFSNTCTNVLPSKDEALINSAIPSHKIVPTHEGIILQWDIYSTFLKDLPMWDEPLDDGVDYSLNFSLPYQTILVKDDDIMVKEGDMIDNPLDNNLPYIYFNNIPSK